MVWVPKQGVQPKMFYNWFVNLVLICRLFKTCIKLKIITVVFHWKLWANFGFPWYNDNDWWSLGSITKTERQRDPFAHISGAYDYSIPSDVRGNTFQVPANPSCTYQCRVFVIGLQKTGTSSMATALTKLGYTDVIEIQTCGYHINSTCGYHQLSSTIGCISPFVSSKTSSTRALSNYMLVPGIYVI